MQDEMNQKVNHDWRDKKREWYRAIWIECAELMDHHGWKWWKKQANDIEQVQLEIIDIWHFGLSMLLESSNNQNKLADHIADDFSNTSTSSTQLLEAVETFAGETLSTRTFSTAVIIRPMTRCFRDTFGFGSLVLGSMSKLCKCGSSSSLMNSKSLPSPFSNNSWRFHPNGFPSLVIG